MPTLTERTLVLGHRGACAYEPENTMESFRLALEMGADGIETDVHFSKDGVVVINHDEKLDRTTNAQGLITDYTLEELKFFDFGFKFRGKRTNYKVCTLEELYELFVGSGKLINIEVKSADERMAAALVDLTKRYSLEKQVIYSSFNHLQLDRILKVNPDAFVAPLYGFNMMNPGAYASLMGAKATHPRDTQFQLFPDYVEKCHALGIRVHTWTVDDPEEAKVLADLGVDAIITNKPDVILKAIRG